MERELWSILMRAANDVARSRKANAYHEHDHQLIVRVHLWAVLHDRPTSWACVVENWDRARRPASLPSQPTMSRRMRSAPIKDFLEALGRRLLAFMRPALELFKIIDGKPLPVSRHSADADATFGRAAGCFGRGYKLHAIWGNSAMPFVFTVRSLHEDEKIVARELIAELHGEGYLLGDTFYDSNPLHKLARAHGHQLVAPRKCPETGLGHHRHEPGRLRSIELLEGVGPAEASFGAELMKIRRQIETLFGNLTSFGGGLTHLPPWVRGLQRVQTYVHTKLLINAARIRANRE
jgi:hypothetical protein